MEHHLFYVDRSDLGEEDSNPSHVYGGPVWVVHREADGAKLGEPGEVNIAAERL
jgi:hypothetical protein